MSARINPLAAELNAALEKAAPEVLAMLSERGKRLYFPKGILSPGAEAKAKGKRFNATIGIATEGDEPMNLPSLMAHFEGLDACVTPVLDMGEAQRTNLAAERRMFPEVEGVGQPAPAPRFSRTPPGDPGAAFDEDDPVDALGDWGIDPARCVDLADSGVIG